MARETIHLRVKGQDLIDAVKKVADKPVVNKDYQDGHYLFVLGQTSKYPYKQLIVKVEGDDGVDPEKVYDQFSICEHEWDGDVFLVGYGPKSVINAVQKFAMELQSELAVKAQNSEEPNKLDTSELRKAAKTVFLATDDIVAEAISSLLSKAADEIDSLRSRIG